MGSMRDAVSEKVDNIRLHHHGLKTHRLGFLIRPCTLAAGWIITIVGLIAIPLPGPGWLTVFVGIGVLSLELHWAKRLLNWGVRFYERFFAWYHIQSKKVRYGLVAATCACAWIAVIGVLFISWKVGAIPALNPVIEAVLNV
ncbi:TIGR02611 family protein [Corynebacterium kutscheri]|uniref:TIGR02611 family protein n=1 Tax=Corynebacterium kutscheri TaxID=35755 RepID=A0A0F6TCE1_9CORY|nr:TIGR02611 family protein [Corynebacterium kutscheri]AKE40606.1 TIGR02611 family protein [Corynebacterium kutscheri]VEH11003.1 hypothetical membrane protein [Corynebacterium kutscheri]